MSGISGLGATPDYGSPDASSIPYPQPTDETQVLDNLKAIASNSPSDQTLQNLCTNIENFIKGGYLNSFSGNVQIHILASYYQIMNKKGYAYDQLAVATGAEVYTSSGPEISPALSTPLAASDLENYFKGLSALFSDSVYQSVAASQFYTTLSGLAGEAQTLGGSNPMDTFHQLVEDNWHYSLAGSAYPLNPFCLMMGDATNQVYWSAIVSNINTAVGMPGDGSTTGLFPTHDTYVQNQSNPAGSSTVPPTFTQNKPLDWNDAYALAKSWCAWALSVTPANADAGALFGAVATEMAKIGNDNYKTPMNSDLLQMWAIQFTQSSTYNNAASSTNNLKVFQSLTGILNPNGDLSSPVYTGTKNLSTTDLTTIFTYLSTDTTLTANQQTFFSLMKELSSAKYPSGEAIPLQVVLSAAWNSTTFHTPSLSSLYSDSGPLATFMPGITGLTLPPKPWQPTTPTGLQDSVNQFYIYTTFVEKTSDTAALYYDMMAEVTNIGSSEFTSPSAETLLEMWMLQYTSNANWSGADTTTQGVMATLTNMLYTPPINGKPEIIGYMGPKNFSITELQNVFLYFSNDPTINANQRLLFKDLDELAQDFNGVTATTKTFTELFEAAWSSSKFNPTLQTLLMGSSTSGPLAGAAIDFFGPIAGFNSLPPPAWTPSTPATITDALTNLYILNNYAEPGNAEIETLYNSLNSVSQYLTTFYDNNGNSLAGLQYWAYIAQNLTSTAFSQLPENIQDLFQSITGLGTNDLPPALGSFSEQSNMYLLLSQMCTMAPMVNTNAQSFFNSLYNYSQTAIKYGGSNPGAYFKQLVNDAWDTGSGSLGSLWNAVPSTMRNTFSAAIQSMGGWTVPTSSTTGIATPWQPAKYLSLGDLINQLESWKEEAGTSFPSKLDGVITLLQGLLKDPKAFNSHTAPMAAFLNLLGTYIRNSSVSAKDLLYSQLGNINTLFGLPSGNTHLSYQSLSWPNFQSIVSTGYLAKMLTSVYSGRLQGQDTALANDLNTLISGCTNYSMFGAAISKYLNNNGSPIALSGWFNQLVEDITDQDLPDTSTPEAIPSDILAGSSAVSDITTALNNWGLANISSQVASAYEAFVSKWGVPLGQAYFHTWLNLQQLDTNSAHVAFLADLFKNLPAAKVPSSASDLQGFVALMVNAIPSGPIHALLTAAQTALNTAIQDFGSVNGLSYFKNWLNLQQLDPTTADKAILSAIFGGLPSAKMPTSVSSLSDFFNVMESAFPPNSPENLLFNDLSAVSKGVTTASALNAAILSLTYKTGGQDLYYLWLESSSGVSTMLQSVLSGVGAAGIPQAPTSLTQLQCALNDLLQANKVPSADRAAFMNLLGAVNAVSSVTGSGTDAKLFEEWLSIFKAQPEGKALFGAIPELTNIFTQFPGPGSLPPIVNLDGMGGVLDYLESAYPNGSTEQTLFAAIGSAALQAKNSLSAFRGLVRDAFYGNSNLFKTWIEAGGANQGIVNALLQQLKTDGLPVTVTNYAQLQVAIDDLGLQSSAIGGAVNTIHFIWGATSSEANNLLGAWLANFEKSSGWANVPPELKGLLGDIPTNTTIPGANGNLGVMSEELSLMATAFNSGTNENKLFAALAKASAYPATATQFNQYIQENWNIGANLSSLWGTNTALQTMIGNLALSAGAESIPPTFGPASSLAELATELTDAGYANTPAGKLILAAVNWIKTNVPTARQTALMQMFMAVFKQANPSGASLDSGLTKILGTFDPAKPPQIDLTTNKELENFAYVAELGFTLAPGESSKSCADAANFYSALVKAIIANPNMTSAQLTTLWENGTPTGLRQLYNTMVNQDPDLANFVSNLRDSSSTSLTIPPAWNPVTFSGFANSISNMQMYLTLWETWGNTDTAAQNAAKALSAMLTKFSAAFGNVDALNTDGLESCISLWGNQYLQNLSPSLSKADTAIFNEFMPPNPSIDAKDLSPSEIASFFTAMGDIYPTGAQNSLFTQLAQEANSSSSFSVFANWVKAHGTSLNVGFNLLPKAAQTLLNSVLQYTGVSFPVPTSGPDNLNPLTKYLTEAENWQSEYDAAHPKNFWIDAFVSGIKAIMEEGGNLQELQGLVYTLSRCGSIDIYPVGTFGNNFTAIVNKICGITNGAPPPVPNGGYTTQYAGVVLQALSEAISNNLDDLEGVPFQIFKPTNVEFIADLAQIGKKLSESSSFSDFNSWLKANPSLLNAIQNGGNNAPVWTFLKAIDPSLSSS